MKHHPFYRIWQLLIQDKKDIVAIYFYAMLSGMVQLSVPVGIQAIIGLVLGASMITSLYVLICMVVLGVLMVGVFQINQMRVIEKIQQQLFARYAFAFAEKIPRLDLVKTDQYYLPEKMNRFFDTVNVQKGLSKILLDVPTASIQILFGLMLLSLYHPVFIVFGILLLSILWVIMKVTGKNGLATSMQESEYKYKVVAWFEEMARIIKSFKLSPRNGLNLTNTDKNVANYVEARTEHFKVLLFQFKSLVAFKVIIVSTMLIVGTYLLLQQQLNIGEFIATEIVILTVINSVEKLISSLESVYDILTGIEKLASVIESPEEKEGLSLFSPSPKGVHLECKNLSFTFPDGNKVLHQLNLDIKSGMKVCLSGDTGAGKSTLIKILSGNYSQFEGVLLVNELPIHNYDFNSFRQQIGMYRNQHDLFYGTMLENVTMGRTQISIDQIKQVAQEAGLDKVFSELKDGFHTVIDPAGRKLPEMIIKKILLLRALVHQPDLLLLEDPWHGLDPRSSEKLQAYLLNEDLKATVIIISNLPEVKAACPINIHLQQGQAIIHSSKASS